MTDVLAAREAHMLLTALSTVAERGRISSKLGLSYDGDRKLYEALGYPKSITYADYLSRYRRQDIAKAVINKPVHTSWRKKPELTESKEEETPFEVAWKELVKKLKIWNRFRRVDKLASIGEWAVLLIGFADGRDLFRPVGPSRDILYLTPYSQGAAKVKRYVEDSKDERFGQPDAYEIQMRTGSIGDAGKRARTVHWSRVLHVTGDNLESDTKGTPVLEAVYNRLMDLEKILGGSGEGYWEGAFPGLLFKKQPGVTFSRPGMTEDQVLDDMKEQMQDYVHRFTRMLRLSGIDVEQLKPQLADPGPYVAANLKVISAATGIPERILMGSERGQLASSMDEINWLEGISERREDHCEPMIVRPFVDRLMVHGILPEVEDYTIDWPDLFTQSDKDRAEIAERASKALKAYVESGADVYMPFPVYLKMFWSFTDEQISMVEEWQERERGEADGDGTEGGEGEED